MSASENLSPQVLQRLMKDLRKLARRPPEGIKYVPNTDDNIGEIHCLIFGPKGTPYSQGAWRVKLVLGQDFPNSPPKGFFLTRIFHPNIAKNGDICVNTLKKDWKPEMGISHVLQVIRCLLIVPFPESSLNDEAGKMFMESYDEYAQRATLMTRIHALKADAAGKEASVSGEETSSNNASGSASSSSGTVVVEENVTKKKKLNDPSQGSKKKKSGKSKKKRNKDRL
jgi:ubiquitin-conjugating enzyme E2 S